MTPMTEYLTLEDLLALIGDLGVGPVRDLGLLESAAHRPTTALWGRDVYATIEKKAAALLDSLVRDRPLADGNKRLGWLAALVLLDINGRRFTNEDVPGQNFANIAELQPRMVWYLVTDANYPNHLPMQQPGHGAVMEFAGDLDAWNAAVATGDKETIEAEMEAQGISGTVAWTIDELAEGIHVDPTVLNETVTRYNEMCT